ncbi:calcium-binding protein, partial [Amaricoccus sp.]|uniref:calcium-binding protein n=1 Tax=Amaricoccus sp. TaxID=1872485 RepID=UPI001B731589
DDHLDGGDGRDTLQAGAGNDTLLGGRGSDVLDGGGGFDTASYIGHGAAVTVNMTTGTASSVIAAVTETETDTLAGIERIVGSSYNDQIVAGATTEVDAGAGDDWVWSGPGGNRLVGGLGEDSISYGSSTAGVSVSLATGATSGGWAQGDSITGFEHLYGSAHDDTLTGNALANTIFGNGGADVISAGGGNDVVMGGAGADRLSGGSGVDTFRFGLASDSAGGAANHDWIMDFQKGLDRIDLRGIDANAHVGGFQSFTRFIGNSNPEVSSDFTAGTISWRQTGGDTLIDINISDNTTNGWDAPEMQIRLDGLYTLTVSDFIL